MAYPSFNGKNLVVLGGEHASTIKAEEIKSVSQGTWNPTYKKMQYSIELNAPHKVIALDGTFKETKTNLRISLDASEPALPQTLPKIEVYVMPSMQKDAKPEDIQFYFKP